MPRDEDLLSIGDDGVRPLFLGGTWSPGSINETLEVENPATGAILAKVAVATADDVGVAVRKAETAQYHWGRVPAQERAAVLVRLADLLEGDSELLARIVTREVGKPITQARDEVSGAAAFARFFAGIATTQGGDVLPSTAANRELWLRKEPLGVVAAIIPWNFPLALTLRKLAPAVAAGNAVVVKPSELTPLSALAVAELCVQAGLPAGVVSVLPGTGPEVGSALVAEPGIAFVTMTGSVSTGRLILEQASRRLIPVSLELGGKAPFIVFEDADLDAAVRDAVATRMINSGQSCVANERTMVHRDLYDEFVSRYVTATEALTVGDPEQEGTQVGPRASSRELRRTQDLVEDARESGAVIAAGGSIWPAAPGFEGGHWYAPTVLTNVPRKSRVLREEIFGPVTPVLPFSDEDEAVRIANDTAYGLSSYVYTQNFSRVMRMTHALRFAEVFVNRPGSEELNGFHAGWGVSGLGGDDGTRGFAQYSRVRSVYTQWSEDH